MTHVKITSTFTDETWEGNVNVDINFTDPNASDLEKYGTALGLIYRFFNRVDADDAERLADIGYDLPSMSPGDLIEIDEMRFHVLPIGFQRTDEDVPIPPLEAYQRASS